MKSLNQKVPLLSSDPLLSFQLKFPGGVGLPKISSVAGRVKFSLSGPKGLKSALMAPFYIILEKILKKVA